MKQYYEIKSKYEDCILFFRLGDFYEMFGDDAKEAAEILDITLTSRSKGDDALPMCGIPYHSSESYIAKLNQKGKRVAVCEQVSDPSQKGIVERAVQRVVTPSTNMSESMLEAKENQFLLVVSGAASSLKACIVDISTGEIYLREISKLDEINSVIANYGVKELIIEKSLYETPEVYEVVRGIESVLVTSYPQEKVDYELVLEKLNKFLSHYDKNLIDPCILAGGYLTDVIGYELEAIQRVARVDGSEESFELDKSSVINLEIFYTIIDGNRKNSLVNQIDYTKTSMGGRLLRKRLIRPLKVASKINERLDIVSSFIEVGSSKLEKIQNWLGQIYDLDRLLARVNNRTVNPKDFVSILQSIEAAIELKKVGEELGGLAKQSLLNLHECPKTKKVLSVLEREDVKVSVKDGGIFCDGYNDELDELRDILVNGKDYLLKIQKDESDKNDIPTLKLGFNKVFGYYLEVSKGKTDRVPEYFIRKQTLSNSERYITPELKEYEEKVLSAQDRVKELEFSLFNELIERFKEAQDEVVELSTKLAKIDVAVSQATLALSRDYVRPEIREDKTIEIKDGRHPVIENIIGESSFIPNDVSCSDDEIIKIITGPNMGGKSTYLRQTALICLLGQIGSYVPASSAVIGVVDQIFSRVGAADNLSMGESTFMVEMKETAYILNQATEKSLIIMDEVGRGTSTSDGLSLASGIVDYLSERLKSRVLFATHYHELVDHVDGLKNVHNLSISVTHDENGKPIFLHKIVSGGIDKSYGIEVAESAGLPEEILESSRRYLEEHELGANKLKLEQDRQTKRLSPYDQSSLFVAAKDNRFEELLNRVKEIEVNKMTPIQALQNLNELVESIKEKS